MIIEVAADKDYERLDIFLSEKLDKTRTRVQHLIKNGYVRTDEGMRAKPASSVKAGCKYSVELPESLNMEYLRAEPVDFDVLYEDEYLFVINKPSGVIVHPAPGHWRNTLVNGLVYRYPEMRKLSQWLRPGIVHRLDIGTSGLMIVARTEKVTLKLQSMFKNRTIHKHYIALVHGCPEKSEGILSGPIDRDPDNYLHMIIIEGGKPSLTGYKVLWSMNDISLVECELFTGRTHQIRVHMSALGCPLVGDGLYGAKTGNLARVYLHSWKLEFAHPVTGEAMKFRQPLTSDFIQRIALIKSRMPIDEGESENETVSDNIDGEIDVDSEL
ncbi:MAG: RluA family pseudouridine synthase [Synergistaceae bacterium]|nr:RluA family pseudouridine synthase [Synergistaceae bacterium]